MKNLLIIALLLVSTVAAQKFKISGKVVDEKGAPLIGANVILQNTLIGTATNFRGQFVLSGIKPGQYRLAASMVGYNKFITGNLTVDTDIVVEDIKLTATSYQSDQIIVTAGKYQQDIKDLPVSAVVIDSERITEKNFKSLDEVLRYTSGVSVTLDQVSIRGSSGYSRGAGTRVLVALDGIPLYSGDSGEIIWEIIPLHEIERIEIIKGAASSLYGSTALGGVINVITKNTTSNPLTYINSYAGFYDKPSHEEWRFSENIRSFYGATFSHSRSIGNLGISVSAAKSKDLGYRQNDWDERHSGFLKLNFNFSENTSASFIGTGYTRERASFNYWKNLRNAFSPPDEDYGKSQPSQRFILGFNLKHIYSDDLSVSIMPSYYRTNWEDESESKNRSTANLYRLELQSNYRFNKALFSVAGVEFQFSDVASNIFGNNHSRGIGVFSQFEYKFTSSVKLSLGARYDYNRLADLDFESAVSPKAGINYQLNDKLVLRASFGLGFRAPSLAEAFTSTTTSGVSIKPNPALKSESNYSFEAGLNYSASEKLNLDLAVFNSEYKDMIEPHIDPFDGQVFFDNVTRSRIFGIEFNSSLSMIQNLLRLKLGYTFLSPKDIDNDDDLKYRSKHSILASLDAFVFNMNFGADFRYASRFNKIDRELVDLGIVPDGDRRVEVIVLDLRAAANLFNYGIPLRLYFNANNVLNYTYVEMIGNISPIRNFSLRAELLF